MPLPTPLSKPALRAHALAAILAIPPAERPSLEARIRASCLELLAASPAGSILLYASAMPEEIDTLPLIDWCLSRHGQVILPRIIRVDRRLDLHRVRDRSADLQINRMGIPEPRRDLPTVDPQQVDWALVPGLAFDRRGYRLGRGAGYYDRLLPRLSPTTPTWSIAFTEQLYDTMIVESHDFPVMGIITPDGRWKTSPGARPIPAS